MRVLFTTQPGLGHFQPMVSLAHALVDAGHDVAVACPASFAPIARTAGMHVFPAGYDWDLTGGITQTFPEVARRPVGPERVAYVMANVWAGITAQHMADDLLALAERWPFDLVVRETLEFGGCLAAERLNVPHAVVQTVLDRPGDRDRLRDPLARHRARLGLPPDPDVVMPYRYLQLTSRPPSLLGPPLVPTRHSYRSPLFDRSLANTAPAWLEGPLASPVIFATLGTVANRMVEGLLSTILDATAPIAGTLVLAAGPGVEASLFGPQPGHVHVESYVPQSLVFPRCDLVIDHGGSCSMMASLTHGLPQVLIPIAADQHDNAAVIAAHGLGRVVGPDERTVETIADAVRDVLAHSAYRERAERARDEIAALPGPERAVVLLEQLARTHEPVLAPA